MFTPLKGYHTFFFHVYINKSRVTRRPVNMKTIDTSYIPGEVQ